MSAFVFIFSFIGLTIFSSYVLTFVSRSCVIRMSVYHQWPIWMLFPPPSELLFHPGALQNAKSSRMTSFVTCRRCNNDILWHVWWGLISLTWHGTQTALTSGWWAQCLFWIHILMCTGFEAFFFIQIESPTSYIWFGMNILHQCCLTITWKNQASHHQSDSDHDEQLHCHWGSFP